MREMMREARHLVRAAALLIVGFVLFLAMRAILTPRGFGDLGHYRPGALEDNRARPLSFAGRAACEECHADVVEARKGSRHASVGCEACHGALQVHAADPASSKPQRPDAKTICLVCHVKNVAKPAKFPQVDPKEHAGDSACGDCHKPHHPEIS